MQASTKNQDIFHKNFKIVFFPPIFSDVWSKMSSNLTNERDILLFKENPKPSFKPKQQKHFAYGDKRANTLLCRLRVGRSLVKSHSFSINMYTY